ncbi:MAG: hypothetical protein Q4C04_00335 [Clostridia bacterium]|nr:hypothetical protein [Clostridia bacterium]
MAVRRKRRIFQPRFFLFIIATLLLIAGIIILAVVIKNKVTSCRESEVLDSILTTPDPLTSPEALASSDTQTAATPPPLSATGTYTVNPASANAASQFGFSYSIRRNNESAELSKNPNSSSISFGSYDDYTQVSGILTFGSNHYRNSFAFGTVTAAMQEISQSWSKNVGGLGSFYGVSGQALIIQWDEEVKQTLGIADSFKAMEGFTEVIYPSADGNIYFCELESGAQTRSPINLGVSLRGTATLDPNGYPMLYVGQGVPAENARGNLAASVFAVDLIQNKSVKEFIGKDYFAYRDNWTAFTSSPLIADDTLILPGETGVIYFIKLNTTFNAESKTITIDPGDRIKYRYTGSGYSASDSAGSRWYGFQGSVSAFRNYLYIADNGGRLQCIDVNTLELLYVVDLDCDTDASIAIEEDGNDGTIYLYTVNQVETQSAGLPEGWGYCSVRKIDGLTGRIVWTQQLPCLVSIDGTATKSGAKGTPHIGQGEIANLLICSFYRSGIPVYDEAGNMSYEIGGTILALDRDDGTVVWKLEQADGAGYYSSPLVLYSSSGNAYLVACDRMGLVKLYDISDKTGGVALGRALDLGASIEATPVAFGNYIVVGTTGRQPDGQIGQASFFGLKLG